MTPSSPLVSIVLGSYNRRAFLKAALESVRENGMDFPYEIIVVDGGSTDGSLRYLLAQKDVMTIVQHNRGTWRGKPIERRSWGYFMNLGFKCAQGKYICMISDDSLLIPGAIKNGVEYFEQLLSEGRKVGALAFYWREWPGSEQYWVGRYYGKIFINHGIFLRHVLEEVNWIDEKTYQFYHADSDLSLRIWQQGYEILDSPDSFVEHFSHANTRLRRINNQHEMKDFQALTSRWQPKDLGIDISTEWLVKTYEDPEKTYRKFPHLVVFIFKVFNFMKQMARNLKVWVCTHQ